MQKFTINKRVNAQAKLFHGLSVSSALTVVFLAIISLFVIFFKLNWTKTIITLTLNIIVYGLCHFIDIKTGGMNELFKKIFIKKISLIKNKSLKHFR